MLLPTLRQLQDTGSSCCMRTKDNQDSSVAHVARQNLISRTPKGGGGGGRAVIAGGSRGGSSGSSGGGRAGVSFGGGSRGASSRSGGGGSPVTISSGPFVGRTAGGGTREQVYGTTRYGSGYASGGVPYVSGRNFTFGYWPIYLPIGAGVGYYGYQEYGPAINPDRPGGAMHQAIVRSSAWPAQDAGVNNATLANNGTASYYIVGDADSVAAVMDELVSACSVTKQAGVAIDETNSTVHFEQAVQYYRASSFMLALTSYNNSANLPANAPTDNTTDALPPSADTPLPPGTDMNFVNCLNHTIGEVLPIMDGPGPSRRPAIIAMTVIFSLLGAYLLFSCVRPCCCRRSRSK